MLLIIERPRSLRGITSTEMIHLKLSDLLPRVSWVEIVAHRPILAKRSSSYSARHHDANGSDSEWQNGGVIVERRKDHVAFTQERSDNAYFVLIQRPIGTGGLKRLIGINWSIHSSLIFLYRLKDILVRFEEIFFRAITLEYLGEEASLGSRG